MGSFLMLLAVLMKWAGILQMQLFQINQSEESSKITINAHTPSCPLHELPITWAAHYRWITLIFLFLVPNIWKDCSLSPAGLVQGGCCMPPYQEIDLLPSARWSQIRLQLQLWWYSWNAAQLSYARASVTMAMSSGSLKIFYLSQLWVLWLQALNGKF